MSDAPAPDSDAELSDAIPTDEVGTDGPGSGSSDAGSIATGPTLRGGERLQKVLARAGLGSRRVCEDLIEDGRVSINGERAVLGARVDVESDVVAVDGVPSGCARDWSTTC